MNPSALFVDYGQPAAAAEEKAISILSEILRFPLQKIKIVGPSFNAGEIRGRNAFLLHLALLEFPADSGTILIGVHAGNGYADCSPSFLDLMQRSFEFHSGGSIALSAPLIDWSKNDVIREAISLKLPTEVTYSCEAGNQPCGDCDSCIATRALRDVEISN